jgi:hypothetical protein
MTDPTITAMVGALLLPESLSLGAVVCVGEAMLDDAVSDKEIDLEAVTGGLVAVMGTDGDGVTGRLLLAAVDSVVESTGDGVGTTGSLVAELGQGMSPPQSCAKAPEASNPTKRRAIVDLDRMLKW